MSLTSRERAMALGKVGGYLLLPLALIFIPTTWIEARPPVCLIHRFLGLRCPGCGMTRALSCAAHGHPRRAFRHNKLVVIVLPLLGVAWLRALSREWQDYRAVITKQ